MQTTPMIRSRSYRWLVSAILLAALVSCANDPDPEVDPVDPETSLQTETGDTPEPETPTENPSISLPSLPIGGSATESADVDRPNNQCVDVNWIVDEEGEALLREGIEVEITGVIFTPELFVGADTGCSDSNPSCSGYVFSQDAQVCNLAVEPLPGAELLEEDPFVALSGNVTCTLPLEECQAFAEAVAQEQNLTIPLLIPQATGV